MIHAPQKRVFDLSRSIDAHIATAGPTGEKAIAGKISGLIEYGETVTWSALHFGVRQRLTAKITQYERPHSFTDEMLSGAFKSMKHHHEFIQQGDDTLMKDTFEYQAPLGLIGAAVEKFVLNSYMKRFLVHRNTILKQLAETEAWREFIND